MRIAIYNDSLDPGRGGPATFVIDLARGLAGAGHNVRVLTGERGAAPAEWAEGTNPALAMLPGEGAIGRAVEWADAVHLNGLWVPAAASIARWCRRLGKRYVLSLHGTLNDWPMAQSHLKKRLYLMTAGRGLLKHAGAILCTSRREMEQAAKWAPREKLAVLPPVMDLAAFERSPGPGAARAAYPALAEVGPWLLFLGRLHPVKGLEHLLRAMSMVRAPVRLAIAGGGDPAYAASLRALADELELGSKVAFLGAVAPELRASLYRCAALFVLPSSQENFGLVLFEAMAAGVPVLTTDRVDTRAELEAAGALIVRQEPAAIAAGIDAAMASGPALEDRARQGRAWVGENLNPARILDRYGSCYAGNGA